MDQLEKDVEWLKANIKHLSEGQAAMQEAISKLVEVVADIHAMQNDITRHGDEIQLMRTRFHEQANYISGRPCKRHADEISRLTMRADNIEERLEHVEVDMPTVQLASSWLFKALLGSLSMVAALAGGIILHWFKGGFAQ